MRLCAAALQPSAAAILLRVRRATRLMIATAADTLLHSRDSTRTQTRPALTLKPRIEPAIEAVANIFGFFLSFFLSPYTS